MSTTIHIEEQEEEEEVGIEQVYSGGRQVNDDELLQGDEAELIKVLSSTTTISAAAASTNSKGERDETFETTTNNDAPKQQQQSTTSIPSNNSNKQEQRPVCDVVDASTPLFTAICDTDWTQALEIVENEEFLHFCNVYIVNSTENWKRLPLHEACRRQAPAWLVAALIRASPNTVQQTTSFQALPLHLAVEHGTSPEVINLLLTSYWQGVLHRDSSGQTPLDLCKSIQQEELYDFESTLVIMESLSRATTAYKEYTCQWQDKYQQLQTSHATELQQLRTDHANQTSRQLAIQTQLESKLHHVEDHVESQEMLKTQLESLLQSNSMQQQELQTTLSNSEVQLDEMKQELTSKNTELQTALHKIADQERMIAALSGMVEELQEDLHKLYAFQQNHLLNDKLARANIDLGRMLQSQQALEGLLIGQQRAMVKLLQKRGIPIPKHKPDKLQEDADPNNEEQEVADASEAANAAAIAATRALSGSGSLSEMHD